MAHEVNEFKLLYLGGTRCKNVVGILVDKDLREVSREVLQRGLVVE